MICTQLIFNHYQVFEKFCGWSGRNCWKMLKFFLRKGQYFDAIHCSAVLLREYETFCLLFVLMITVNLIKNGHISQPEKFHPPNPNNFPNPDPKTLQLPSPSPFSPKSSFPFVLGASHANKNKGGLPYQGKLAYSQANHFYPHCLQVGGAASTHPTRRINLYIGLCRLYY